MAGRDCDRGGGGRRERPQAGARPRIAVALWALTAPLALAAQQAEPRGYVESARFAYAEYQRAEPLFWGGDVAAARAILLGVLEEPNLPGYWRAFVLVRAAEYERVDGRFTSALARLDEADGLIAAEQNAPQADLLGLASGSRGIRGQVHLDLGLLDRARACFLREAELAAETRAAGGAAYYAVVSNFHRAQWALAAEDYEALEAIVRAARADPSAYADYPADLAKLDARLGIGLHQAESDDPALERRARSLLEGALDGGLLDALERVRPELVLADIALAEGDLERARARLAAAEQDVGPARERSPEWPLVASVAARLALAEGAGDDVLRERRDALALAVAGACERWRGTELLPSGFGIQQFAPHRGSVSDLIALELRLDLGAGGVERALAVLLELQTLGSLDRRAGTAAPSLAELRGELLGGRLDHGVLCWFPGPLRSHLFVLDGRTLEHRALPRRDALERARAELVRAYLRLAAAPDPALAARRDRAALELRDALLPADVRERMASWSRLSVVGLDLFGELPFEALPFGDGWVGTELAVDAPPSLPLALALARRGPAALPASVDVALLAPSEVPVEALALDPSLRGIELPRARLAELVRAWPAARRRVWCGDEAGAGRLAELPPATGVLQVLAHGVHDASRAGAPATIALQDGLLATEDVAGLDAPELVLLTACGVADAPLRRGDAGAADLGGAFLDAGARAVVLSSFDLDLEGALRLSRRLHAGLAAGETPAEAVRAARAELARDARFADPLHHSLLRVFGYGHRPLVAPPARGASAVLVGGGAALALAAAAWLALSRRRKEPARAG